VTSRPAQAVLFHGSPAPTKAKNRVFVQARFGTGEDAQAMMLKTDVLQVPMADSDEALMPW
jgi:hypothetical protein